MAAANRERAGKVVRTADIWPLAMVQSCVGEGADSSAAAAALALPKRTGPAEDVCYNKRRHPDKQQQAPPQAGQSVSSRHCCVLQQRRVAAHIHKVAAPT